MIIKVWDVPTRAFHWLLALTYGAAFLTSESEWLLEYHTAIGYFALGLTAFRVLWGFTGNRYAKFSGFIRGWGEIKAFLSQAIRLKPPRYVGHNPAVGWIIVFMLFMTAAIASTGIITYSGEEMRGAFAGLFTYETASYARQAHEFLTEAAIVVIVVHVCAALFHDFIMKENIIVSMITGRKEDPDTWKERVSHMAPGEGLSAARLVIWVIVAIMGGAALVFLPPEGSKTDFRTFTGPAVINEKGFAVAVKPNETWKAECAASCHSAFHPTLLPSASWDKIMSGLSSHFGDDVTLDEKDRKEILAFLISSSAERSTTEASRKILNSIKRGDIPVRVTDTPYWKDKHSDIPEDIYRRKTVTAKTNCAACHPGAEAGSFEDKDINIPMM